MQYINQTSQATKPYQDSSIYDQNKIIQKELYCALQNGEAEVIRDIQKKLPKKSDQLLNVLFAEDRGIPGLYMALQEGHAEAIRAYGRLLDACLFNADFNPEQLLILLTARNEARRTPGLHVALENGRAEAI